MSDHPFKGFKFQIASPDEIERADEIKEGIKNGTVVYAPYIPMQVTPTLLNPEPDVVDKLAAVVDPELKAKHEADAAVNRDHDKWMKGVFKRHGHKIKLVDGSAFMEQVTVDNL